MFPSNIDLSNPLGIIGGAVGIISTIATIIVLIRRSNTETSTADTDNDKTNAETQQILDRLVNDKVKDIERQIKELRESHRVDSHKIKVLTLGFKAQNAVLERTSGHGIASTEERAYIDAAKALIE